MKKSVFVIIALILAGFGSKEAFAYNTAGCMLHVDPSLFNHSHLTQLTWKAEISEYDYVPSALNPFMMRIEFNSVGFSGNNGICYIGAMIQNVGHTFLDDAYGNIASFPALGLYLTALNTNWPDSSYGVKINLDTSLPPQFGRCFENIDNMGYCGKNIYTRQNVGCPSPSSPITVRWTVTKGQTVENPQGNFSRNLSGEWVPLIGTFVKWNFMIEINDVSYNVADYYLPIEYAEYILATDPLVLHQEYFGSADKILDSQKCTVSYSDIRAYDEANWYNLKNWKLTWRIDDGAGNSDNRFGWKSDGPFLISRVGHESDITECFRDVGSTFTIAPNTITYTISGTILVGGSPLVGVVMSGLTGNPTTNASGVYTATVNFNWSGTVTPTLAGYAFSPANRVYTNVTADQLAQNYTAFVIPDTIILTSPNGGESWQAGTTHDITWAGSTAITNVKIELSFNGGSLWSTIIASTPNDGSYLWDIGTTPSLGCVMRISDVLGTASDMSDAMFVLTSPPSLTNNYFILPVKWTDTPFGSGGWYVGDYDGDGRSDLLRYLLDGTRNEVLLSTGSAFAAGTNWLTADHGADGWHVGDYNGDGRSDLMRYVPGVSGAQVFLSNGSNFIYSGSWSGAGNGADGWYVGDYNGDGRDDIMRYVPGVSGADVFLSDGTKFNYSGNWSGAGNGADGWYIGDFNGDGRSDLLRYYPGVSGGEVFLSDGTKFTYSGSWTGAGNGDNGWYLGKFSGTARTDIMRYVLLLSGADVFLNTGSGFTYDGSWTPAGRGDNDWHVGDFNGDGRDDLMRSIVGVTGADVLISNASGGATLSGKPLATQTKGDKGRWLGDVPFSEKEWDGAEEKAFVAAIKKRIAGGEELSVYQIQKEYEKLKGKVCRRVSIMKLLKHYQWDSMYRIKADDLLQ